jgi:NADH:ubiquinone oxidoreductase subunit 5 (subunit L)/multisubunit Na+/H+ antiporter MnhA subunit
MEAPVPISAQLHSSTLVIIGFYVIYRLRAVLEICDMWRLMTVCSGTLTAVVASVLGFFQDDAKRLLACSTASQLGYVMTLIGVGALSPSLLLLTFCCCNKAYAFV